MGARRRTWEVALGNAAIQGRFTHHPTVGDGVLDVPARRQARGGATLWGCGPPGALSFVLAKRKRPRPRKEKRFGAIGYARVPRSLGWQNRSGGHP